jgi:hypothetical protein
VPETEAVLFGAVAVGLSPVVAAARTVGGHALGSDD